MLGRSASPSLAEQFSPMPYTERRGSSSQYSCVARVAPACREARIMRAPKKPRKEAANLGTSRSSLRIRKGRTQSANTCVVNRNRQLRGAKSDKDGQHVLLRGTIPEVVRWTRQRMDEESTHIACNSVEKESEQAATLNPRTFAQTITQNYKVDILLNGSASWKGETRLWENLCSFAAKLPGGGRASNIFDAMSRYPASILVCYGLKAMFGRYIVVAGRRIPRLALRQNAYSFFSPHGNEETFAKKWFEADTLSRMQETVTHMCAISEYILRCVYMSKNASTDECDPETNFFSLLERRIQEGHDHLNRRVLRFEPWDGLNELDVQHIAPCLESSMNIAHEAVMEGVRLSVRIYCQKEGKGKERERIKLWMLKRPLPEIMDCLIRKLEAVVCDVLGSTVDIDDFRLQIVRYLRRVVAIYEEVGDTWSRNDEDYRFPREPPSRVKFLTLSTPYNFCFSRSV